MSDSGSGHVPEIAYRRSLRAARARRAVAARSRRNALHRRGLAVSVGAIMALSGGVALAGSTPRSATARPVLQIGSHGASVRALQRALHVPADGSFGPRTRRALRSFQRHHGLEVDGVAGPLTLSALGLTPRAASVRASQVVVPSRLASIAQCESGGDPRAVSADGTYRGKYQFDRQTWASVGGRGDPAAASEPEQDRRAVKLYKSRGAAPWGVCGSR